MDNESALATMTVKVCKTHEYDETTINATCVTNGSTTKVCKNCKKTIVDNIEATGHVTPTEYSKDSTGHWKLCSNGCGTYVVAKTNHSGGTATCTVAATCSACKQSYGSALGHNYSSKTTTSTYLKSSATCQISAAYYYKCSMCTAKGTATYTSGNPVDHSFTVKEITDWYLAEPATCTTDTRYCYKCKWCEMSSYLNGHSQVEPAMYYVANTKGHKWVTVGPL